MPIVSFTVNTAGQLGANPRRVKIITTDDLATITTAGYISSSSAPSSIYPTDVFDINYDFNTLTNTGTYGEFSPTFTGTSITLTAVGGGSGAVDSVNGLTGVVVLDSDDIAAGSTNKYVTTGSIVNTDVSPTAALAITKLQNISTDSLIGRDTAGTGSPETLTVGGGLEFTGSGGIQRSAVTGAITMAAGSNASTLSANAVVTSNITDTNVTLPKIQNIATDSILGRDTAGSGAPEVISVSGGIEFTGSGGIRRSAISGDITIAAGSGTAAINNGAVTGLMLSSGIFSVTHCVLTGKWLNSGGSATVTINEPGIRSTDIVWADIESSANSVSKYKTTPITDNIVVLFSGDPGNSVITWKAERIVT